MKTYVTSAGAGALRVELRVTETGGEGLACFLSGGTLPHVGGQALASPGLRLHGRQLSRCDLWVATVPGHKDSEVAANVAKRLCLATGEPVSVTAGIHVDDATPEQVQALMRACGEAADLFLQGYRGDAANEGDVRP